MSSKITTEKYDVVRLEKIKHHLESLAERGNPKYYEIYVDNMKVVDKTNDPNEFDEYKMYVDENTQMLKLLLYTGSETSPRNDKFIYSFDNGEDKVALGEVDVQNKISTAIIAERERIKIEFLENKVEEFEEDLTEANNYIEKLESGLEQLKTMKSDDSKQLKYGMIASVAIEELLKRNPSVLKNLPIIGALSGLLEPSNENQIEVEGKTSFSEKTNDTTNIRFKEVNKKEDEVYNFSMQLMEMFSPEEFEKVILIINKLHEDKSSIDTISDLLFTTTNN